MNDRPDETDTTRAATLAGELRVLIGTFKRKLQEQTYRSGITWSQVSVLVRLERDGPATVTNLARAEGVRPQSMGAIVGDLEANGFVNGAPDPKDGRQTILSLTDSSRELIKAGRAAHEGWLLHAIQAHYKPDELDDLTHAIDLLKRLVEL